MSTNSDSQIDKYDRVYGALIDVCIHTKPSTIKTVQTLTGRSDTFIVQTLRHDENGDYIFIECLSDGVPVRLALPPKVANLIAAQRDSLTKRRRSIASKRAMKTRMASGEVLNFKKRKGA